VLPEKGKVCINRRYREEKTSNTKAENNSALGEEIKPSAVSLLNAVPDGQRNME